MKGLRLAVCSLLVLGLVGCSSAPQDVCEPCPNVEGNGVVYVDSYTSASSTRFTIDGDDLIKAQDALVNVSSDLASLSETQVEGYAANPNEIVVQIMSVNPDGSVGFSTIHAWQYNKEANTVTVELTDGQNAQNLNTVGDRGSLFVSVNGTYYILHLKTKTVNELKYTDEAFNNGEFNSAYTGAGNKLSEFNIVFDVTMFEQSYVYMFN